MTADNPQIDNEKTGIKISPVFLGHFVLILCGVLILVALQRQYWYGEFGRQALDELENQLVAQKRLNATQQATNDALRADIDDLKSGLGAIEEHARLDLGFIKSGETFVEFSAPSTINEREMAVGVDSSQAVESADGLLDETNANADTGVSGDVGEETNETEIP